MNDLGIIIIQQQYQQQYQEFYESRRTQLGIGESGTSHQRKRKKKEQLPHRTYHLKPKNPNPNTPPNQKKPNPNLKKNSVQQTHYIYPEIPQLRITYSYVDGKKKEKEKKKKSQPSSHTYLLIHISHPHPHPITSHPKPYTDKIPSPTESLLIHHPYIQHTP